MRTTSLALFAAASAASAQSSGSMAFFYPDGMSTMYNDVVASVIDVGKDHHTTVAFMCKSNATSTASSAQPTSTGDALDAGSDSDSDEGGPLADSCDSSDPVTVTVGSDFFDWQTTLKADSFSFDYTISVGCTSQSSNAVCTLSSAGTDAWAEYCESSASTASNSDDLVSSCLSAHTNSPIPATTTTLSASEVGTATVSVTAGAEKLSAGASASASSASATSTGKSSGKASGSSTTKTGTATGSSAAKQTGNAATKKGGAELAGVAVLMAAVLAL